MPFDPNDKWGDFLGQQWNHLKHSKQLVNKNIGREWKYGKKKWIIADEGTEGTIEDQDSGYVLGLVENSNTNAGTMVILQEKNASTIGTQTWLRTKANSEGFFLITNPATGKVLTALNKDNITIRGM